MNQLFNPKFKLGRNDFAAYLKNQKSYELSLKEKNFSYLKKCSNHKKSMRSLKRTSISNPKTKISEILQRLRDAQNITLKCPPKKKKITFFECCQNQIKFSLIEIIDLVAFVFDIQLVMVQVDRVSGNVCKSLFGKKNSQYSFSFFALPLFSQKLNILNYKLSKSLKKLLKNEEHPNHEMIYKIKQKIQKLEKKINHYSNYSFITFQDLNRSPDSRKNLSNFKKSKKGSSIMSIPFYNFTSENLYTPIEEEKNLNKKIKKINSKKLKKFNSFNETKIPFDFEIGSEYQNFVSLSFNLSMNANRHRMSCKLLHHIESDICSPTKRICTPHCYVSFSKIFNKIFTDDQEKKNTHAINRQCPINKIVFQNKKLKKKHELLKNPFSNFPYNFLNQNKKARKLSNEIKINSKIKFNGIMCNSESYEKPKKNFEEKYVICEYFNKTISSQNSRTKKKNIKHGNEFNFKCDQKTKAANQFVDKTGPKESKTNKLNNKLKNNIFKDRFNAGFSIKPKVEKNVLNSIFNSSNQESTNNNIQLATLINAKSPRDKSPAIQHYSDKLDDCNRTSDSSLNHHFSDYSDFEDENFSIQTQKK
jgi:hypothetical protein